MTEKFKVYAQTRATRQDAGDIAGKLAYDDPERIQWEQIESLLQEAEYKLEKMNLK